MLARADPNPSDREDIEELLHQRPVVAEQRRASAPFAAIRQVRADRGAGRLDVLALDRIEDALVLGVDPAQDRERFYVSENGVTLVTASMLRAPARSGGG